MLTRAQIIQILEGELNLIEGRGSDDTDQVLKPLFEDHGTDDSDQLRQALKLLIADTDDDAQLYQAVKLLIEDHGTGNNAPLHQVLKLLIAALKALEEGEVPPLFEKKKVTAKGKWPSKVRKSRFIAIGAVKALVKSGYKVGEAIEIVARSHGVSPDAVRQWRKTQGKDTDVEAQGFMSLLPSSCALFKWTNEDLLNAVKQAGDAFKDAQEKKG